MTDPDTIFSVLWNFSSGQQDPIEALDALFADAEKRCDGTGAAMSSRLQATLGVRVQETLWTTSTCHLRLERPLVVGEGVLTNSGVPKRR